MRTSNSIKNSITGSLASFISMLVGFISQAIFIKILGAEYLGLNGLFSNVLTMLSIFELGVGNAIVYNLYKPIANNDIEKIKSLMSFYKNSYNVIALTILILGLMVIPFLNIIVGDININVNIYIVYILFLLNTISSYVIAYKRSLIYANQKNYIINIIHIIYIVLVNTCQLLILFLNKNFYLYLIVKIAFQLFENICINMVANKLYPFLLEKKVKQLDKKDKMIIFKKVKALFFHKIGNSIVFGTDNIIISYYLGVTIVGLYSNYSMIINAVNTLFNQFRDALTASVGNLLVTENDKKAFDTFKKVRFINFWLATFSSISILVIMTPFITIWIGKKYLLSNYVLIILSIDYFQKMMRSAYSTFKDSAGLWYEDRFIPLIESLLNILLSIFLLKYIGLPGVFLGTILSGLTLWIYSYPKLIYKGIFNRSYYQYFKETIGYIIVYAIVAILTWNVYRNIIFKNIFTMLIQCIIICLIVPNLLLYLIFRKTENFSYFKKLFFKIIESKLKKRGCYEK